MEPMEFNFRKLKISRLSKGKAAQGGKGKGKGKRVAKGKAKGNRDRSQVTLRPRVKMEQDAPN